MMNERELLKQLLNKDKQINELYVVIDTLQTNLRSTLAHVPKEEKKDVKTQSFKWCVNWKPGDENE